jgi:uncharacterized membrane protein
MADLATPPPAPEETASLEDDAPPIVEPDPTPFWRKVYLLGPLGLTLLIAAITYLVAPAKLAGELVVAGLACLVGFGTTVIFSKAALGSALEHATTWHLFWVVLYVTVVTGFFYTYNLDLLHRVRWLGPKLKNARHNAVATLRERPWIRRWAMVGVAVFILLPLPGSGSFGGSLVGRLIGLTRLRCFLTVAAAGVLVCLSYAGFGTGLDALGERFNAGWPVRVGVVALLLLLLWLVLRWVAKMLRTPAKPAARPATPPTGGS